MPAHFAARLAYIYGFAKRRPGLALFQKSRKTHMKSRAAVAFKAGEPLQIVEIDVAPPQRAKC